MSILGRLWRKEALVSNDKLMRSRSKRRKPLRGERTLFEHIEGIEKAARTEARAYPKKKYYVYTCASCGDSRYFMQQKCGNCGGHEFTRA